MRSVVFCLAAIACSKSKPDDKPAPAIADATIALAVPASPDAADNPNKITITVAPDRPAPDKAFARRCTLGGDPLVGDCIGGSRGIAFDRKGTLYVVAGANAHRYTRTAGDDCRFEPAGDPITMPPENKRPQSLDGPVYLRSGGPAWQVVATSKAVYVHDFLGGMFRIDTGKPTPACVDVFGYSSVTELGDRVLVRRKGIEQLALGKKCKAKSAGIDDKVRGDLHAIGDRLYVVDTSDIARYDGTTRVPLAEGTRLCGLTGFAACGDGACAIDNNCMQVIQLGADDKVLRAIDDDKLFATRPWSLGGGASHGGSLYIFARHRDTANDKEICEVAVYELPAAVLAI